MNVLVDIRTSSMSLDDAVSYATAYAKAHPHEEVWLDGDSRAIVTDDRRD